MIIGLSGWRLLYVPTVFGFMASVGWFAGNEIMAFVAINM